MNTDKKISIAIVGSGNVGTHLFRAFEQNKIFVQQIVSHSNSHSSVSSFPSECKIISRPQDIDKQTDLVILAVPDDVLNRDFLSCFSKDLFLVHTSGSVEMSVFADFENYGVFYPLQTFSIKRELDYSSIPFCIEANTAENETFLFNLASKISLDVRLINSQQRRQIHLAAVFACNFSNYLFHVSETILKEKNLDFEILFPLLSETIQKVHFASPREMQTGPAIRQDVKIMQKHLALLSEHPEFAKLYEFISNNISKLNKNS